MIHLCAHTFGLLVRTLLCFPGNTLKFFSLCLLSSSPPICSTLPCVPTLLLSGMLSATQVRFFISFRSQIKLTPDFPVFPWHFFYNCESRYNLKYNSDVNKSNFQSLKEKKILNSFSLFRENIPIPIPEEITTEHPCKRLNHTSFQT